MKDKTNSFFPIIYPKDRVLNINPKTFLLEAINPTIKDALKKRTDDAHDKGIFGAPSFVVNNKIFWGQDRLEFVINEAKK